METTSKRRLSGTQLLNTFVFALWLLLLGIAIGEKLITDAHGVGIVVLDMLGLALLVTFVVAKLPAIGKLLIDAIMDPKRSPSGEHPWLAYAVVVGLGLAWYLQSHVDFSILVLPIHNASVATRLCAFDVSLLVLSILGFIKLFGPAQLAKGFKSQSHRPNDTLSIMKSREFEPAE